MSNFYTVGLFVIQIIALYFVSRITINHFFYFFRSLSSNDHVVFSLISALFLPGTIIHELSHFLMAIILFLRVREIHIFPQWEKNYIKLGRVLYEKKDPVRGMIVGIAPIIAGLLFFWLLATFNVFPNPNILVSILAGYSIFIVSTTMFSSKQDLVDIVFVVPFIIIIAGIVYVVQIDVTKLFSPDVLMNLNKFLYTINWYAFFSLVIHAGIIGLLKLYLRIRR